MCQRPLLQWTVLRSQRLSAGIWQTGAVPAGHKLAKGRQVWDQSGHGFPAAVADLPGVL